MNQSGEADSLTQDTFIAGIFDMQSFNWGTDIFAFTINMIQSGWFDDVEPRLSQLSWQYAIQDSKCDESAAIKSYWNLRGMDGIVGTRCSGASISISRIASLEGVPQISPSATSSKLSDKDEFPNFSRLVAPDDRRGEVGATVAMLRAFRWKRVTILSTDTQFSTDWTTAFRELWTGPHSDETGNWNGQVTYSNTIRLNLDGTLNTEAARQVLKDVPVDNPQVHSRIIILVAYESHAYALLQLAEQLGDFPSDSIWVGPSAWTGRKPTSLSPQNIFPGRKRDNLGFLGVAPLQYRGDRQQDFFLEFGNSPFNLESRSWGVGTGSESIPTFAPELVDSIVSLATALARTPRAARGNLTSVNENLRSLEFEGMSGWVSFTPNGDRRDPQFAILQGPTKSDGIWRTIGQTGADVGSAQVSLEVTCFPSIKCGVVPQDSYPVPKEKLAGWVLGTMIPIILLLLCLGIKYRASHRSKRKIKAELQVFRESVVATRTVEIMYLPSTSTEQQECHGGLALLEQIQPVQPPTITWCWKETPCNMSLHPSSIVVDATDCWIKYNADACAKLEEAFQRQQKWCKPQKGYRVDLSTMLQTKNETSFQRAVQRFVKDNCPETSKEETLPNPIDTSNAHMGSLLPEEIANEPQMVLLPGDVVQVSKNRPDGLAFGTKLFNADEKLSRDLATALSAKSANEISDDTGWFEFDVTRLPTGDDLKALQANVGDTAALDPPTTWDKIVSPTVVQMHELLPSSTEYKEVSRSFLSALLSSSQIKIRSIQRVQNMAMWQSYVVKRQTICYRDSSDTRDPQMLERGERRWLYHGTNIEVLDKILQQGFNRSFCGKNATMYGKGIYHARDASYSSTSTYAVPDRNGNQYILACRVAVGEYCLGRQDALTPDVRHAKTHTLYDSTVDSLCNPSIYVTYHDAQTYPEYLIKFKRT